MSNFIEIHPVVTEKSPWTDFILDGWTDGHTEKANSRVAFGLTPAATKNTHGRQETAL